MDVPDEPEIPESSGGNEEAGHVEKTGQESRFIRRPIAIEIQLYLVLISELPPYFKLGPVPFHVFEDGINPGVIIGVRESRARGCVLLAFANPGAQTEALAYLHGLQDRRVDKVMKTLCGSGTLQFWRCSVSLYGEQDIYCSPTAEPAPHTLQLLEDTWTSVNPIDIPLTVCVMPIQIDVEDPQLASDLVSLWELFVRVSSHVAIAAIKPAVPPSNCVTLYVFDLDSVGHLQRMIKDLRGVQVSADNLFGKTLICTHVLTALRPKELSQGFVLEPGPLRTGDLKRGAVLSSRVHTMLSMQTQADKFTVCCFMDSIEFVDTYDAPWTTRSNVAMWTVVFSKRYVGFMVLNKFQDELHYILESHGCKVLHRYPDGKYDKTNAGVVGITLQGPVAMQQNVYYAGNAVLNLAKKVEQQLVFGVITIQQPYLDALVKFPDGLDTPCVFIEKPPVKNHRHLPVLCRAEISCSIRRGVNQDTVQIDVVPNRRVSEADVDAVVVFTNSTFSLLANTDYYVVEKGQATVVSERQACLLNNGTLGKSYSPALSSGCLMTPALIYTNLFHPIGGTNRQFLDNLRQCVKSGLVACKKIRAKSVALSFPGIRNMMGTLRAEWFNVVCKQIAIGTKLNHFLGRILIPTPGDADDVQLIHQRFIPALTAATQQERLQFRITQNEPESVQVRCPLPVASALLVATSEDDLQQAERSLKPRLAQKFAIRDVHCATVACSQVVRQWRKFQMDVKTGALLVEKTDQPQMLQLQGIHPFVKDWEKEVKKLLQDMQEHPDSFCEDGVIPAAIHGEGHLLTSGSSTAVVHNESTVADSSVVDDTTQSLAALDVGERAAMASSRDKPDADMIDQVAATGKANLRRVRGFLCGEYGTGKSSLLRALLGDEFIPNADSTKGVDVQRTLVQVLGSDGDQMDCLFVRFREIRDLYSKLTAEHVHKLQIQSSAGGPAVQDDISDELDSQSGQGLTEGYHTIPSIQTTDLSPKVQPIILSQPVLHTLPVIEVQHLSSQHDHLHNSLPPPISFAVGDGCQHKFQFLQHNLLPSIVDELERIRDSPDDMIVDRICVELWDCGGQMSMTTQQSVCFDTTRSFFLLLFDVTKDLKDEVTEEVFYQGSKQISIPPLFKGMTHLDFLLMWLSVISLRQQRHALGDTRQGENKHSETQVFFVGSHIDKVVGDPEETISAVKKAIAEISKKSESAGTVIKLKGPYFVDNRRVCDSVSDHSNMTGLMKDIRHTVCSIPPDSIPLTRMKLEDALYAYQKHDLSSPAKAHESASASGDALPLRTQLTYEEFEGLAKFLTNNEMSSTEVSAALTYYHQLGSVICNDHESPSPHSHVFLNTGWILQQFVLLVTSHVREDLLSPCDLELSSDVEKLKESGVLSEPLLNCLWSHLDERVRKSLMDTMCSFDLACLISPNHDPTAKGHTAGTGIAADSEAPSYFIPFCTARRECSATMPSGGLVLPAFVLHFRTLFFPPLIFSRVSIHCIDYFKAENPAIDFSAISFDIDVDHYVRISWMPKGLKVELCSFDSDRPSAALLGRELLQVIDTCLEKLNNQGYNGLDWEPMFCCEWCEKKCQSPGLAAQCGWTLLSSQKVDMLQKSQRHQSTFKTRCSTCKEFTQLPEDFFFYWLADYNSPVQGPSQMEQLAGTSILQKEDARATANRDSGQAAVTSPAQRGAQLERSVSRDDQVEPTVSLSPQQCLPSERWTEGGNSRNLATTLCSTNKCDQKVALLPESASTSGHTTVNIHISNSNVNVGGIPGFSEFTDGNSAENILPDVGSIIEGGVASGPVSKQPLLQELFQPTSLSCNQIDQVCQSENVQSVYQEVICALPDSNGASLFNRREAEVMMETARATSSDHCVQYQCLFKAFTRWSSVVKNGVALLEESMSDPNCVWQGNSRMTEARDVIQDILKNVPLPVVDSTLERNMELGPASGLHIPGRPSQPISLSSARIDQVCQSEKVQLVYSEVICSLPDVNGGSFFTKRQVKEMAKKAHASSSEGSVQQQCLLGALMHWSQGVQNAVDLLNTSMRVTDSIWEQTSSMREAKSVIEDILLT